MRHGSLFSGIGGFDLAAHWMGWENVFHCEINPFCNKVLNYYWPQAISYNDIKTTDFTIHRGTIDVLSGGFPCQPYSHAGKRKGKEDERHLWPEMLRAVREIKPSWVIGENVYGLINWSGGLVFDEVQANLEAEGYEIFPYVLPACGINAPHKRERLWFIAHANEYGRCSTNAKGNEGESESCRLQEQHEMELLEKSSGSRITTNNTNSGTEVLRREWKNTVHGFGITTDSNNKRLQEQPGNTLPIEQRQFSRISTTSRFESFPTQSPLCCRNDGISTQLDGITFPKWRNESIKGYGNAVVPQIPYQLFKIIEQLEHK